MRNRLPAITKRGIAYQAASGAKAVTKNAVRKKIQPAACPYRLTKFIGLDKWQRADTQCPQLGNCRPAAFIQRGPPPRASQRNRKGPCHRPERDLYARALALRDRADLARIVRCLSSFCYSCNCLRSRPRLGLATSKTERTAGRIGPTSPTKNVKSSSHRALCREYG